MNQGIYGFPSTLATSSIISITDFDASGTYTIPTDASEIEILLVGGGGGGGSGARSCGTSNVNRGGGGGGSGGGLVYQKIQTKDLIGRNNLIITIGAGGGGGARRDSTLAANGSESGVGGFPGANSTVTISNYPGFVLQAGAGGGGGAGTTPLAAGSGAAPGRSFLIASAPSAMEGGGLGNSTADNVNGLTYSSFRSTGGAGGGSVTLNASIPATTPLPGGSIKISRINTNTDPLFLNLLFSGITLSGFTALYGGQINGGSFGGKGDDGFSMHKESAGSYLFGGFGGAGGGGATANGGGNGGDGYRGGGGGGGGGVYSSAATLSVGQLPSGAGGNGGNGFCRIIARR